MPRDGGGGIDDTERDSIAAEDLTPEELHTLVFPEAWHAFEQFACAVSKQAFRGWVKQPSPSCAAASLAGALNILNGYSRADPHAYTYKDVLTVYHDQFQSKLARQKRQLQAALGYPVDSLEVAMQTKLNEYDLQYGGAGKQKLSKPALRRFLLECIREHPPHDAVLSELARLLDLSTDEGNDNYGVAIPTAKINDTTLSSVDVDVELITDEDDDDAPRPTVTALVDVTKPTASCLPNLLLYFHRIDGIAKLARTEKPSTAMCGNAALLEAATYIHSTSDSTIHKTIQLLEASAFMGRKTPGMKVKVLLSAADSSAVRTAAWKKLWAAFTDDCTVLIYHLKNHYALVFALREFKAKVTDGVGSEWTRQVLTSRRGQRPTTWIDWDEVHATLVSWPGYKMLSLVNKQTDA
ncbi:Aste57867_18254 [Aphanomyces stellatus]|uniref:Aste57867_18254 protein n=1 Tax=Aphanomyces stellatus TaxID=120398 RepID=A0A485LAH3_9STRA|nr:hypothetical protein As57867_018192 [Aphanomyces stellatus]VFT94991.1 Aste57867_18254 [Aphanomyces stellatus]